MGQLDSHSHHRVGGREDHDPVVSPSEHVSHCSLGDRPLARLLPLPGLLDVVSTFALTLRIPCNDLHGFLFLQFSTVHIKSN